MKIPLQLNNQMFMKFMVIDPDYHKLKVKFSLVRDKQRSVAR